jgi:GAF domain-containing protein
MEAAQRRYLAQEWTAYLQMARSRAYATEGAGFALSDEAVRHEIQQALAHQGVTVLREPASAAGEDEEPDHTALVAPISFRGEVIGALDIHDDDPTREWTEDDVAIFEAVLERMGVVADGLRLLDDTQRRESTERLVREIADRMRRAPDMDALIKTTVQEMASALGTSDAFLQLGTSLEATTDTG